MDAINFSSIACVERKGDYFFYCIEPAMLWALMKESSEGRNASRQEILEELLALILLNLTNRHSSIELSDSWREVWGETAGLTDRLSCRNRSRFKSGHFTGGGFFRNKIGISAMLFRSMLRHLQRMTILAELEYTVTIENEAGLCFSDGSQRIRDKSTFIFRNVFDTVEFGAQAQDLPALQSAIRESFLAKDMFVAPVEFDFED